MVKKIFSEVGKYILFFTLMMIGLFAFCILAGEEDPNNPMPFKVWLIYKLGSMAVLGLCFLIERILHRAGLLPSDIEKELEEDEK